jgi:hypothetical protein
MTETDDKMRIGTKLFICIAHLYNANEGLLKHDCRFVKWRFSILSSHME